MVCKRVYEITKVILNEVFKNEVGFLDKDLESVSTRQHVVVIFFVQCNGHDVYSWI